LLKIEDVSFTRHLAKCKCSQFSLAWQAIVLKF